MGLRAAGLISGLGQGLGEGLKQMQAGIIQQGLQSADREWQTRKLDEQRKYDTLARATERAEERTYQSGEKVKEREYNAGQKQEERGADIVGRGLDRASRTSDANMQIDATKSLHEGDHAATAKENRRKIEAEVGEKGKDRDLKREELAEQREYHKGLNARMAAAKPHLPPEQQAKLDVLKERSKELERQVEKFSDMGSKAMDEVRADEFHSKAEQAMEEQNRVHQAMEALVGVEIPKAPATGSGIKDRFSTQSPLTKGK